MTTAAFIRKWLANPEKHYDEHCRNEMLDDLYSVIEQAQTEQKLNVHGIMQGQPSCPKCGKIDWIYSPKDECVKCLTCWEAARSVANEAEDKTGGEDANPLFYRG
jgi:hypothetical protein